MNRLQRAAVLVRLVDRLREQGSWCGETHIQKATYFLQELLDTPTELEFILYKHGPFSFDLRDELTSLRADGILELEPQAPPYGPKFTTTRTGEEFLGRSPKTLAQYESAIDFVARSLGGKDVAELEKLATALYVTREGSSSVSERAQMLHELKPHVPLGSAQNAILELDRLAEEAGAMRS
jgi:uncharacterized protein YwgA